MSGRMEVLLLKVPEGISLEYVSGVISKIKNLKYEDLKLIAEELDLSDESFEIEDNLEEEDLFDLGKDDLRVKLLCSNYLVEAIKRVVLPLSGCNNRLGTKHTIEDLCIIELNSEEYFVAVDTNRYYTRGRKNAYSYLRALSISGVLD